MSFFFLSYIFLLFFLIVFVFLFLLSLSLSFLCHSFFARFIYSCLLSFLFIISLFLPILFLLFGLRNYDPGFALVTPLYPSLSLSHTSGISVPGSRVSPGFSHPRSLPLFLFFPSTSVSLSPSTSLGITVYPL